MAEPEHDLRCPLHAIDRRLDDLHRQWHQAEEAYFDPEAFRVAIQTAIQTSRTVSFILQSNKARIPDFDAWYEGWRERLKEIPLMRWMVDARNKIEKQGDLETHSWVRAEILASHFDEGPRENVRADLFDGPKKILDRIPNDAMGAHIRRDGVLRIERRWVENTLPDHELLDAVAIAYGHLALMVADAHRQAGLTEPTISTENGPLPYDRAIAGGRMPCMIGHNEARLHDIWIATGEPLEFERVAVTIDRSKAAEIAEHYGFEAKLEFEAGRDMKSQARAYFEHARRIFLKDGHHIFMVIIFRNGAPVDFREVRIQEHGQKYVFMRQLANDVLRLSGDAVLTIGEVWHAKGDADILYKRVADLPEREEALAAFLAIRNELPISLRANIRRSDDGISLDDTAESEGGEINALAPIYAAWGQPLPGTERKRAPKGRQILKRISRKLLFSTSLSSRQRATTKTVAPLLQP